MKVLEYIKEIEPVIHDSELEHVNRTATSDEILLEMLEHGVQHRGQVLVYYRLLGIEPVKIPYIL